MGQNSLPNNKTYFSLIPHKNYLEKLLSSLIDFIHWKKKKMKLVGWEEESKETPTRWQGRKSNSSNGGKSAEPSGQSSEHPLAQATPSISAALRKHPQYQPVWDLESSWSLKSQMGQTQVHVHCITHVLPRFLKLGNDSIIIRHYSYFQGSKWCSASALMQKLTPISFCKSNALPATGLRFLGTFNLITKLILPQGLAGQMISFYF